MSDIEEVYSKAVPSENATAQENLEADLLEQGLAEEDDDGNVQPNISVTTWTPLKSVTTDPDTGEVTGRTYANYILVLTGWTPNSMQAAGLTQEEVDALLAAGTLSHGTEIGVDVSALDLHESEPKLTTYGAVG